MKIIVACDSFKGSLTSDEVNEACRLGIRDVMPQSRVYCISIADGGEGTTAAIAKCCPCGRWEKVKVCNPIGDIIDAEYYVLPDSRIAVIETAAAAGLTIISEEYRNPLYTDSYGLGMMMADAVGKGCRKLIIGLGGSATNDAGVGMLMALGYRFIDYGGKPICRRGGIALGDIAGISHIPDFIHDIEICCLCDVTNPLLGNNGATKVFGPQKGADAELLRILENGMTNYAKLLDHTVLTTPGAGAAGGIGASLLNFFNTELRPGIDVILDLADFSSISSDADLIITGEGRIDRSSLMGKTVSGILRQSGNIPVVAIGGTVDNTADLSPLKTTIAVTPLDMPLCEAMKPEVAKANIRATVARMLA